MSMSSRPPTGGSDSMDVKVRSTEAVDAKAIELLIDPTVEEIFGANINIVNIIEKSIFSVTLTDDMDNVTGFAAFYDYPNLSSVAPCNWGAWLQDTLGLTQYTALNSVFLHYMVTKSDYSESSVTEMIKSMFKAIPDVHFAFLLVPISKHPDPSLIKIFKPLNQTAQRSCAGSSTLYVAKRHDYVPVLHVRAAKMEDNDDLTPIFSTQKNLLKEVYGDFFVAELIDSQDDHHKAICAEVHGRACGFMSLSSEVNIDLLNESFELLPFHGLRKPHGDDLLTREVTSQEVQEPELPDSTAEEVPLSPAIDYEISICLVGDSGVGKSTLLSSLQGKVFNELDDPLPPGEMQVTVKQTVENNKRVLINVRDTPIKQPDLVSAAMKNADAVAFLYDGTNQESLKSISETWLPLLISAEESAALDLAKTTVEGESLEDEAGLVHQYQPPVRILVQTKCELDRRVDPEDVSVLVSTGYLTQKSVSANDPPTFNSLLMETANLVIREKFGVCTPDNAGSEIGEQSVASSPSDDNIPLPPIIGNPTQKFVPQYAGDSNAFCIQLYCIQEEQESRSQDFLKAAFDLFPSRDFCILTVPHMVPEFPLIQGFVRVTPRICCTLPQELYVFHRNGLVRDFNVRPACSSDFEAVKKLVSTIDGYDNLLRDLQKYNDARRDPDGTPLHAYVAQCAGQLVGVAALRQEEDVELLRSHFSLEDFIYYSHHSRLEHGHIHHFVLSPVFQHLSKYFLKEIMRQDQKTTLYYPVYPTFNKNSTSNNDDEVSGGISQALSAHTLVTCLSDLVPIKPRRQILYPIEKLKENAPSNRILKKGDDYALYHINRKLVLEPKITINARIVVVGASDVGLSYLEVLAFCPHLKFNNLTLLAPHGLPGEVPTAPETKAFLSYSHCYDSKKLAHISLRSWVNIVHEKMVGINRKTKHIITDTGAKVPYDHLILCTGSQYQPSRPQGHYENQDEVTIRKTYVSPINILAVNDYFDVAHVIYFLRKFVIKFLGQVIIYGDTLDAYTGLNSLLALGVPGENIHFVHPPRDPEIIPTCFNDSEVETAMEAMIRDAGVHQYTNGTLHDWSVSEDNYVQSVVFKLEHEILKTIPCGAMICYESKQVDYDAFRAMNDCCLVFDGRLVIDSHFHTNDMAIRAAGSVTKFSRRYYSDEWSHANFNSREVGHELALNMLRLFDPSMKESSYDQELYSLIPLYQGARVQEAHLPGGLNYLHISKPALPKPFHLLKNQPNYGVDLITGSWTKKSNEADYFRIHLSCYSTIQDIICLSRKPIQSDNLICLYGKHERYLNGLLSRYNEGLIKDFYQYFEEPFCLALFHDRFDHFLEEVRDILHQKLHTMDEGGKEVATLAKEVREMVEEDLKLKPDQVKHLFNLYSSRGYKHIVETRLLSYLNYNYYHLPMYARPGMV